jgi:hypothetical protein
MAVDAFCTNGVTLLAWGHRGGIPGPPEGTENAYAPEESMIDYGLHESQVTPRCARSRLLRPRGRHGLDPILSPRTRLSDRGTACLGVLLLFHPTGEGEAITYADLQDVTTRWLVVHIGMLIFIPLMAAVVYLLVRGIDSTMAWICRIAFLIFVVVYCAWEAQVGIGSGILVIEINDLAANDKATAAPLVEDYTSNGLIAGFGVMTSIGSIAFIVATIAAGVTLRVDAGAPLAAAILLGLSGFLITAHPTPFGPIGLVLFIAAVLLYVRSQPAERTQTPMEQPHPT